MSVLSHFLKWQLGLARAQDLVEAAARLRGAGEKVLAEALRRAHVRFLPAEHRGRLGHEFPRRLPLVALQHSARMNGDGGANG